MLASLLCTAIWLYMLIVLVRILMSWIPPTPGTTYAQVYEVFDRLTEPVLAPIRSVLGPVRMGAMALDLSPFVVFIVGTLLLRFICG
jgi:YggT family protein